MVEDRLRKTCEEFDLTHAVGVQDQEITVSLRETMIKSHVLDALIKAAKPWKLDRVFADPGFTADWDINVAFREVE